MNIPVTRCPPFWRLKHKTCDVFHSVCRSAHTLWQSWLRKLAWRSRLLIRSRGSSVIRSREPCTPFLASRSHLKPSLQHRYAPYSSWRNVQFIISIKALSGWSCHTLLLCAGEWSVSGHVLLHELTRGNGHLPGTRQRVRSERRNVSLQVCTKKTRKLNLFVVLIS